MNSTTRPRIRQDWLRELLSIHLSSDMAASRPDGYASVSPMFARLGFTESQEEQPFTDLEVASVAKAVERLQRQRPDLWIVLHDVLRPWAARHTQATPPGTPSRAAADAYRLRQTLTSSPTPSGASYNEAEAAWRPKPPSQDLLDEASSFLEALFNDILSTADV